MKILVIDDSDLERSLLIEVLKGSGISNEFLQAKNGDEAIEFLGRNYKDICLMLLDWQMPQMSGMEFMESVIKVVDVSAIPIVMVTASGTEENKKKAYGVNQKLGGYVVKPYDPDGLVKTIKPYLK